MDPETIVQRTVVTIHSFLAEQAGPIPASEFEESVKDWTRAWRDIESWLRAESLTDARSAITSFARSIPNYDSFGSYLSQSLALHQEFWEQVFKNLVVAKSRLP